MSKLTVREWLTANVEHYDNRRKWIKDCAEQLQVKRKTVQEMASEILNSDLLSSIPIKIQSIKVKSSKISNGTHIISKDKFLLGIDIVKQILTFLDKEVGDSYIENEKLRRHFQISIPKWKEIANLPIFETRKLSYLLNGTGQKNTVWSSKEGIENAKATLSMARYE